MAEKYYSLTDLMRLTDNLVAAMPSHYYGVLAVRSGITTLKSADVVEVVRCKNCKFSSELKNDEMFDLRCGVSWDEVNGAWYCSHGIRKDEPIFPLTFHDVVEVVRCKNCKHRRAVKWADGTVHWECVLDSGDPYEQSRHAEDDDWFCGDGEAKDG